MGPIGPEGHIQGYHGGRRAASDAPLLPPQHEWPAPYDSAAVSGPGAQPYLLPNCELLPEQSLTASLHTVLSSMASSKHGASLCLLNTHFEFPCAFACSPFHTVPSHVLTCSPNPLFSASVIVCMLSEAAGMHHTHGWMNGHAMTT